MGAWSDTTKHLKAELLPANHMGLHSAATKVTKFGIFLYLRELEPQSPSIPEVCPNCRAIKYF